MSIIFDGNFKQTDKWQSINGEFGAWKHSCLNPSDTLTVVPAPGRSGEYAGLWKVQPDYGCFSDINDNHAQVYHFPGIITGEYWYGNSIMLDSSTPWPTRWSTETDKYHNQKFMYLGFSCVSAGFADPTICAPDAPGQGDLGCTFMDTTTTKFGLQLNPYCTKDKWTRTQLLAEYKKDVWHDWMYNIKWAKDATGFIHIYHRIEGQPWEILFSKTNIITKKDIPGALDARFGCYRGNGALDTQKFYGMRYKIGTTRADVEYPQTECPAPQCSITISQ